MAQDVTVWKQKDLEQKMTAYKGLLGQFPALQRRMDNMIKAGEMEKFRNEYPAILIETVATSLGIPHDGITILGGKPYINKTGLLAKIQHDPRRVKRCEAQVIAYPFKISVASIPESKKESFIGCTEDGTTIARGIVEFEDGSTFVDEATANPKYLTREHNKMESLQPYAMEMALTRAMNRAMRLATGVGLTSIEELNERGFTLKDEAGPAASSRRSELIEQVNTVADRVIKAGYLNTGKFVLLCNRVANTAEVRAMNDVLLATLIEELEKIEQFQGEGKKENEKAESRSEEKTVVVVENKNGQAVQKKRGRPRKAE